MMALSPLNQQRLHIFKNNKRALVSAILLGFLFIFTLFAELIANNKPLLVKYNHQYFFPVFTVYAETSFGGDFDTEADYSDNYVQSLINNNGYMVWPLIPYHYDTHISDLSVPAPSPPDAQHWLGTDDQARDVLARTIYGFRISIIFALALTFFSSIIGVAIGAMQGYFGGLFDLVGQRLIEIWSGLPELLILIIIASMITPNIYWLFFIMLFFKWTALVDLVRAETLKARKLDYVRAAKALGVSDTQILIKHILPNTMVATTTFLPFMLAGAVGTLTALDFLGFGLPPGSASLGELLSQGKNNIHAHWLGLTGFFSVSLLLTLLVFIGEGIRDAFDPRLNQA